MSAQIVIPTGAAAVNRKDESERQDAAQKNKGNKRRRLVDARCVRRRRLLLVVAVKRGSKLQHHPDYTNRIVCVSTSEARVNKSRCLDDDDDDGNATTRCKQRVCIDDRRRLQSRLMEKTSAHTHT